MHLALYRKYRPKTFDEVVGQEHITTTLKNEVALGRPAHSYLFTGSRGTGKTSCAKIMAKALNCQNPQQGNPCLTCDICRGVEDGSVLDVVEIDAASNNGVDNIRDLRDEANFTPAVGRYRVYIIDEAHMLSAGAFNALLKIMEEPPEHVIFILATTEVHKVPATILSRCQRFDFRRIGAGDMAKRLLEVAGLEEIALSDEAALLIAHLSDGGMRDALSLLDLCSSYSREVTLETVTQAAGVAGQDHLFALGDCIRQGDVAQAVEIIDGLSQRSLDAERLCEQLITHYRNLMIARAVPSPEGLVSILPSDLPRLAQQGKGYGMEELLHILATLQETLGRMGKTTLRKTELEMAMVRLCNPALSTGTEALLRRIEALETALRSGTVEAAAPGAPAVGEAPSAAPAKAPGAAKRPPPPEPEEAPLPEWEPPVEEEDPSPKAPQPTPPPEERGGAKPSAKKAATRLAQWPEVLARLERANPALHGALRSSTAYQSGGYVLVDYRDELFLRLMRANDYAKDSLKQAILEVTGQRFNLGPYREEQYTTEEIKDPLEQFVENLQLPSEQVHIK